MSAGRTAIRLVLVAGILGAMTTLPVASHRVDASGPLATVKSTVVCSGKGEIGGFGDHGGPLFGVTLTGQGTCVGVHGVQAWSFDGSTVIDASDWHPGLRCPFTGPLQMTLNSTIGTTSRSDWMVAGPSPVDYPGDIGETPVLLHPNSASAGLSGAGVLSERIFLKCVELQPFFEHAFWSDPVGLNLSMT
jgi:hypothetical protein